MIYGISKASSRRIHVKIMSGVIVWDILLILQIEVSKILMDIFKDGTSTTELETNLKMVASPSYLSSSDFIRDMVTEFLGTASRSMDSGLYIDKNTLEKQTPFLRRYITSHQAYCILVESLLNQVEHHKSIHTLVDMVNQIVQAEILPLEWIKKQKTYWNENIKKKIVSLCTLASNTFPTLYYFLYGSRGDSFNLGGEMGSVYSVRTMAFIFYSGLFVDYNMYFYYCFARAMED